MQDVPEHDADRHGEQQQQAPGYAAPPGGRVRPWPTSASAAAAAALRLVRPARDLGPCPAGGAPGPAPRSAAVPSSSSARTRSGVAPASASILPMRAARLEQRGQQQVLAGQPVPGLARLLRRHLDQALGVRGVDQLLGAAARPAAPATGLEPLPDAVDVEAQTREHGARPGRPGPSSASTMCSAPIASCSSRTASARAPSRARCALGAQRVWIHAGRGRVLAQSGFASSTSMMGMPSSTG